MPKLLYIAIFLTVVFVSKSFANDAEDGVDEFLDDILSSEVVAEEPEVAEEEPEEELVENLDSAMPVPAVTTQEPEQESAEEQAAVYEQEDFSSLEDENLEYAEQEEDYESIEQYYNRAESETDGFYIYDIGEKNSSVLQNINAIFSPSSSMRILELESISQDSAEQASEEQTNQETNGNGRRGGAQDSGNSVRTRAR